MAKPDKLPILLSHGYVPDTTSAFGIGDLALASMWLAGEHVDRLVKTGCDVHGRTKLVPPDQLKDMVSRLHIWQMYEEINNGGTALRGAAAAGNYESVSRLLQVGTDRCCLNFEGYSYVSWRPSLTSTHLSAHRT